MLHSFGNGTDGRGPVGGLIFDAAGNLYGMTIQGGTYCSGSGGCGTVFELTPAAGGSWTEQVLYSFCPQGLPCTTDGYYPRAGLIFDGAGNLYGTTDNGGTYHDGTVFELTPAAGGTWTEKVLHNFNLNGTDGALPLGSLILDAAGNLYGTTSNGGTYTSRGTVFELTPTAGGGWTETVLHSFGNGTDGVTPEAGLIFDAAGNLYGTTTGGGTYYGGTVFELTPAAGGGWTEQVLHSFGSGTDGAYADTGLIFDAAGNLYGTTDDGGTYTSCPGGCGTVFEITAAPKAGTTTTLGSSANPSTVGEPVTFTATVSPAGPPRPTGTVGFTANGTTITGCSAVPLSSSRTAACTTAALPVGTNAIVATYSGDVNYSGSSGSLSQVVNPGASTTTVTSSQNPSTFGEPVTLTATVAPAGPPAPTGSVSFTSNAVAISGCTAVPLTSQLTAVCTTSTLAVGTDAIVATYSGDTNYSGSSGGLAQLVNPTPAPLQFVAVTPCRLVDTRPDRGGSGPILGGTFQSFPIPQEGGCNIPTTAAAYSLNVSVVPQGPLGYLTIWPTGQGRPVVATLNSIDGRIKADAAIVPAGTSGAVSVYVTHTTNVILDINGYFAPVSASTLAFYPLPPCRVADTRHSSYPQGLGPPYLTGGQQRDFPILNATTCNIPSSAAAYSLNFSVVPHRWLFYLTVWPTGQTRPVVSTLNDIPGTIIANAAIVVAGASGNVSVYPTDDTDLIIDINGYFAPPGTGGLSLYAVAPCRVIDTRHVGSGQPFSGTLTPPVDVTGSSCGPPATAQAYVFNATVVPTGALGYLTLWPDGATKPLVSTLNALDGSITNNMAIVPSTNGKVDAFAAGITQLILDISSYFAP